MEISLIRHGKPVTPSLARLSAYSFINWVTQYNLSGLCPSSTPTEEAKSKAQTCHAIVCSSLTRSIESAHLLAEKAEIISSSLFNEADLPIAKWHSLKLSPKAWAVIFRVIWLLGYSSNSESYKEAKERAKKSVEQLEEFAHKYKSVLFVGHGVYNRLLAKELKAKGWLGPNNPGTKHWALSTYKKHCNSF